MIKALTSAATGLDAQQERIKNISNDMANVNTDGYKRGRVEFQDLMYETIREPGAQLFPRAAGGAPYPDGESGGGHRQDGDDDDGGDGVGDGQGDQTGDT